MAKPIQAGSLASVIELADNPPDQPIRNLTRESHQPLVLYIARVPGSHGICFLLRSAKDRMLMRKVDVFLTTMKPQQKVVTAQDVQSSLYYLHLDRPEDYELLGSFGDTDGLLDDNGDRSLTNPTSASGVRRKPLPPSAMLGLADRLEPLPEVSPHLQTYSNGSTSSLQAQRKPSTRDSTAERRYMDGRPPLPDRTLLGPRPMNQRFLSLDNAPLQDVPGKQNMNLRRWSEQPAVTPPSLPPRPSLGGRNSVPMTPPRPLVAGLKDSLAANGGHSDSTHGKAISHRAPSDLNWEEMDGLDGGNIQNSSLSLIRRYNNEQWTVGKILSKGTKTKASVFGESSHDISIKIMTDGYSRFVNRMDSLSERAATVSQNSNGFRDSHTPIMAAEEQLCFQRHLQVPRHTVSQHPRHRAESTDPASVHNGTRPSFDIPRHSYQSSDSTESRYSFIDGFAGPKTGSKKAYTLRSPWDGICEFTTGLAGRSFKCKHSYASSNPRFGPGVDSAQVSELRFNLPSSKTLGSAAPKRLAPGTAREVKRSSLFQHQHRRRSISSLEGKYTHGSEHVASKVELEEHLDLSLGQEHAGGGFGGKQAKLGKLIVEEEGLQMLDLIVAANMALWWRVYERFT